MSDLTIILAGTFAGLWIYSIFGVLAHVHSTRLWATIFVGAPLLTWVLAFLV